MTADVDALIGNTYYRTFEEAVEASADGDTVLLLRSTELGSNMNFDKEITLDLNGKTLPVGGADTPLIGTAGTWAEGYISALCAYEFFQMMKTFSPKPWS